LRVEQNPIFTPIFRGYGTAAYAFSRLRFRGRKTALQALLLIQVFPVFLAVVALLTFIGTFNEFILASLFLQDISSRTVAVGLQQFIGAQFGANWGAFAAGSVIASIPLVILFLSMQRYIVNGLIAGSVKG
jgi:arabinogalactan oligomer/maltooligosaccharide transport system permease protein